MKRHISLILISIILFSSLGLSTFSANTTDEYSTDSISAKHENVTEVISKEEKILCDATLEDDFEDDSVIVVFKNAKSKKLDNHSHKSFSEISAKSITDLTSRTKSKIERQRVKKAQTKNTYEFNVSATTDEMPVDENKFHQIIKIDLEIKSKENVLACIKKLEARDDVLMACPNYYFKPTSEVYPNDPYFPEDNIDDGQWGSRLIDLPKAWSITTGSNTVKVGILDSGIDKTHPDLKNRYNSSLSKDFSGGNSPYTDITGHGTQVAGIIGAEGNNNSGPAGVCWNVSLVSLKVTKYNSEGEYKANFGLVADAIDYANDNNIPILNFSYCGPNKDQEYLAPSWENYPGLFVCSTTNEKENVTNIQFAHQEYNPNNTIVVTATNRDDELLEFYNDKGELKGSSYSATKVHLAAPGDDIWTTNAGGGYIRAYATSMATPYVAGVAALLKSEYSDMKAPTIKYYIEKYVDKIPALSGKVKTGGRLNAYKALNNVKIYTVKYNANGGSGNMSDTEVIYYNRTALRANTFTREGYVFKGWYAQRASDSKWYYTNGENSGWYLAGSQPSGYSKYLYPDKKVVFNTTSVNGDEVTMTAQWAPKYTVSFNGNTPTSGNPPTAINAVYGVEYTLPSNTFSKTNYYFQHWYAKDSNGRMYFSGSGGSGWYVPGQQPEGYTRVDFSDKMKITASSITGITPNMAITMKAYWKPMSGIMGDVNVDDVVSVKDVTYIEKYLANLATMTSHQQRVADVNFDGNITIKDATLIQKYVSGAIDEFGE